MTVRVTELTPQLARCQEALAAALREKQLLRQKVDLLLRRIFGSSSEKLDPAQLELLALPEGATASVPPPANPRRRVCLTTCPWWSKSSIRSRSKLSLRAGAR
jgi:hypothetical protein